MFTPQGHLPSVAVVARNSANGSARLRLGETDQQVATSVVPASSSVRFQMHIVERLILRVFPRTWFVFRDVKNSPSKPIAVKSDRPLCSAREEQRQFVIIHPTTGSCQSSDRPGNAVDAADQFVVQRFVKYEIGRAHHLTNRTVDCRFLVCSQCEVCCELHLARDSIR